MAHEIFISYSSKDKPIADGICASLEASGLRCWIAPRDILPGEDWPKAITNAISRSRVMVLVFSSSSNDSEDVGREIILAANHKLVIIPFKIENIEPEPGKQYYLARTHWLEAMNPPTLEQIQELVQVIKVVLPASVTATFVPPVVSTNITSVPVFKMKRQSHWIYLAVIALLLLVVFMTLFWPKIQGVAFRTKASPSQTETVTPLPSSTSTPTATTTKTLQPSATPTTGTVTGLVMWGKSPYEGVNILLCSDPVFAGNCKGLKYETITDANGGYSFSEVEPGKYTLVSSVPEMLGIFLPERFHSSEVMVAAGENTNLEPFGECKFNFVAYTPILNNNKSVTLRWSVSPSNEYIWYFGGLGGGEEEVGVQYNSVTTKPFPPGRYIFYAMAGGYGDVGSSCSMMWFTIP